jgi:hypothetical protein
MSTGSPFPLGFITPTERTDEQAQAHTAAVAKMKPRFELHGSAPDPGPVVMNDDLWRHKDVVAAFGYAYPGTHQFSGSCVWAGGENAVVTTMVVEVILQSEPERIVMPFCLFNYGKSRERLGETTEGEGSMGSTFAASCHEDGLIDNAEADLPRPTVGDGLEWGERMERKWSNGRAIDPKWLALGRKHLIRSTAPIKSADQLRVAVRNRYGVTFACNNFITPGNERQSGEYYIGRLDGNGGHQTSIQGVVDTPGGNYLFKNVNQWGMKVYKGFGNAVMMEPSEVDRALRNLDAEIFAFSAVDGFPARYVMVSEADILPRAGA